MTFALIEPAIVPDVFVSGLAEAEDLGDGNFRFVFFTRQRALDHGGAVECVVVARLVMPAGAIHASIQQTMRAMGVACCGAERLRLRH